MRRLLVIAMFGALLVPTYEASAQVALCDGKPATTTSTPGTDGDDVFIGTEGNDHFDGRDGNDSICGMGGDDTLIGFMGDDHIDGGTGNDRLIGCDPSHEKSDAIVCYTFNGRSDDDILIGGDGDDHVFGQLGSDSLEGGAGFDVLDGGSETDTCKDGERYAFCEHMAPPPPPPACDDGSDNDGDAFVDDEDPGCSRPRDPTEDVENDPVCFNGNDDDGDGLRDYPEDRGCESFTDTEEFLCLPCPPPGVTASYDRDTATFRGHVHFYGRRDCEVDRPVTVKRFRRDRKPVTIGSTSTGDDIHWELQRPVDRGRYFAVAKRFTYHTAEGDDPVCKWMRSPTFRVRS